MKRTNAKGITDGIERDSLVQPHRDDGGKRKGRTMKRKAATNRLPYVTVEQMKAAAALDPTATVVISRGRAVMISYHR